MVKRRERAAAPHSSPPRTPRPRDRGHRRPAERAPGRRAHGRPPAAPAPARRQPPPPAAPGPPSPTTRPHDPPTRRTRPATHSTADGAEPQRTRARTAQTDTDSTDAEQTGTRTAHHTAGARAQALAEAGARTPSHHTARDAAGADSGGPASTALPKGPPPSAPEQPGGGILDGPPLRRARLRRPQLVPRRRPDHLGLRRPARPRAARARRRPLPRLALLRGRLLRLRAGPRAGPHRRRAALQTPRAPHPAAVLRRRLRDREGVRDPGPGVRARLRRPAALAGPRRRLLRSPCSSSSPARSPACCSPA